MADGAVAADFDLAPFGEEVHHGDADAVQTAGGLVGALLELAAELEHGHHAFERGDVAAGLFGELIVLFDGDAAAVVFDGDRAVDVDGDAARWWRSRPSPRRSSCRPLRRRGGAGRGRVVSPMYMLGRSRTCSRSREVLEVLGGVMASSAIEAGNGFVGCRFVEAARICRACGLGSPDGRWS